LTFHLRLRGPAVAQRTRAAPIAIPHDSIPISLRPNPENRAPAWSDRSALRRHLSGRIAPTLTGARSFCMSGSRMVRDESCRALQRATALASARCLAASAQAQLRGSDSSVSWRWNANQFRSAPRASFASLFPHNSICSSAGSAQRTQRRNTADCALSARGSPQASPSGIYGTTWCHRPVPE